MANYKILSDGEIRAALAELPDWSLEGAQYRGQVRAQDLS